MRLLCCVCNQIALECETHLFIPLDAQEVCHGHILGFLALRRKTTACACSCLAWHGRRYRGVGRVLKDLHLQKGGGSAKLASAPQAVLCARRLLYLLGRGALLARRRLPRSTLCAAFTLDRVRRCRSFVTLAAGCSRSIGSLTCACGNI